MYVCVAVHVAVHVAVCVAGHVAVACSLTLRAFHRNI